MMISFNFTFPTFDVDEQNETILDVPSIHNVDSQSSKNSEDRFVAASVNEIKEIIVAEMMNSVKHNLSKFTSTKA